MKTAQPTPHDTLKKYWGYDDFRPLQLDIIEAVLQGSDTLGLMPTGGGKSITFQVPTMMLSGLTVVITPIISLMKDQVDGLLGRGIKATYLHSGLSLREMRRSLEKCMYGHCKFLYISPERLGSQNFISHLRQMPVTLIVVDEAHCISQWGYDFRPSYLKIAAVREIVPDVPILALTATATPAVVADIARQLHFSPTAQIFKKSFRRANLSYVVRRTTEKGAELLHILRSVQGSAIVYARSRRKTKEISDMLRRNGIACDYYHAGLSISDKEDKQNQWKSGALRVLSATNAFGMGIDKPDVRLVVHADIPNSLEEYYQEAGRAGRDGMRSWAVLLVSAADQRVLLRHISDSFPEKDFIRKTYERVGNFLDVPVGSGYEQVFDFDLNLFCKTFKQPVLPTMSALRILTQSGYIEFVEEMETQSRVMILATKEELYHIESATPNTDRVLQALLRSYTGLFADYVFISESVISLHFGISEQDIYQALLELNRLHILHYVPRKRTPYVIFTTSREEARYVVIPKVVYQDLKERMQQRVQAVMDYALGADGCREKYLLNYFGEQDGGPCGHCDLCIDRRKRGNHTPHDVASGILYMTQVRPRRLQELVSTLSFPQDEVTDTVSLLVDEGFLKHLPDDTYQNPQPLKRKV